MMQRSEAAIWCIRRHEVARDKVNFQFTEGWPAQGILKEINSSAEVGWGFGMEFPELLGTDYLLNKRVLHTLDRLTADPNDEFFSFGIVIEARAHCIPLHQDATAPSKNICFPADDALLPPVGLPVGNLDFRRCRGAEGTPER